MFIFVVFYVIFMTMSNKFFSGNEYGFATKVIIKTLLLSIYEEGHNIWHVGVFIRLRLLPVIIIPYCIIINLIIPTYALLVALYKPPPTH